MKIILLVICVALTGCMTTRERIITPVQSQDAKVFFRDGNGMLSSVKQGSAVASFAIERDDRLYVLLSIQNLSEKPFDIHSHNVVAKDARGNRLTQVTEKTLIAEAKRGSSLSNFGYALQMASAGSSGGRENSYHSGSVSDAYGNRYNYTRTTTTYSQQAKQNELNRLKREQNEMNQGIQDSIYSATKDLLKRTTIFPQQTHAGALYFEYPQDIPNVASVAIKAGTDIHTFSFRIDAQ